MLKSDVLWPKSRRFKSKTEWEPIGFFSEALCNSLYFDLKLGFFSSTAINVLSDGFAAFLYNGGKMRMIINDILSAEDKETIVKAKSDDVFLSAFNLEDIQNIKEVLSERGTHFFECLSWLIRNNRLEIKIIRPIDSCGISHSKIGVFSDAINKVAFDGSCNFSRTALIENQESISAFCDWDGESDDVRVSDIVKEFELTFSEQDDTVEYLEVSELQSRIINNFENKEVEELLKDEEQIIKKNIDGNLPLTVVSALLRTQNRIKAIIEKISQEKRAQALN